MLLFLIVLFFFFFSSRRRHTRYIGDWSSDVCSSDLSSLGYGTTGLSLGQRVFGITDWHRDGTLAEYAAVEARNLAPLPGRSEERRVGKECRSRWWRCQ